MKELVIFNFKEIENQFSKSKYPREKDIGKILDQYYNYGKSGKYTLIVDEEAHFINLFGLFVDVETGNIALGMFPDPNRYIYIGNIFEIIEISLYKGKKDKTFQSIDKKYLLELLKICVSCCKDDVSDLIKESQIDNLDGLKYDSIILNMADIWEREKKNILKVSHKLDNIEDNIISIIDKCIDTLCYINRISVSFFGAFIEEASSKEVFSNDLEKFTLYQILDSNKPNMEALTAKYLSMGISSDIIFALKSYGVGRKDRNLLLDRFSSVRYKSRKSASVKKELFRIAESLSSMSYMLNSSSIYHNDIVFNIIDLLRGLGWENSFLFSLDIVRESKNRSLYDSLVDRFHIRDILTDYCISESDFVKGLTEYKKSVLSIVDRGSMYKRYANPLGYCLHTHSIRQILNSGMVFESTGKLVLKKFQEQSRQSEELRDESLCAL